MGIGLSAERGGMIHGVVSSLLGTPGSRRIADEPDSEVDAFDKAESSFALADDVSSDESSPLRTIGTKGRSARQSSDSSFAAAGWAAYFRIGETRAGHFSE